MAMRIEKGVAHGDGVELAWEARGEGGTPLLLIMGLGGRAADWGERFFDALARTRRTIRFDNRGTGASSKPSPPYSMAQMTNDALRVLDATGIARAHVMGLSMGGMIAQRLAIDHAARVDRLVLLSTHAGGVHVVPPAPEIMATFQSPSIGISAREIVAVRVRAITGPRFAEAHADAIDAIVGIALAQPTPMLVIGAQMGAILEDDRSARLPSIVAPTLVVHGDCDRLIPIDNGRAIAAAVPGARLHVLEGCGHLAPWEATDALVELVSKFLAG